MAWRSDPAVARSTSIRSTAPRTASARHDTAFSYRDANLALVIVGVDPDPANTGSIYRHGARTTSTRVHPYSAGGAYVNFMMDEGQERVQASFRDNYDRLATVKKKYDPQNLFRVNQNIRPTT